MIYKILFNSEIYNTEKIRKFLKKNNFIRIKKGVKKNGNYEYLIKKLNIIDNYKNIEENNKGIKISMINDIKKVNFDDKIIIHDIKISEKEKELKKKTYKKIKKEKKSKKKISKPLYKFIPNFEEYNKIIEYNSKNPKIKKKEPLSFIKIKEDKKYKIYKNKETNENIKYIIIKNNNKYNVNLIHKIDDEKITLNEDFEIQKNIIKTFYDIKVFILKYIRNVIDDN